MAISRWGFMAFPLILVVLGLGEANRVPGITKAVEESADMPHSAGLGTGGSSRCDEGCSMDDPPDLGGVIRDDYGGDDYGGHGSVDQQWSNRPLYCVPLECKGLDECSTAFVVNFGVVQATPPEEDPGYGSPDMQMPRYGGKGYSKENGGKPEEHGGAMPPESA